MIRFASTALTLLAVSALLAGPADARRHARPAPSQDDADNAPTKKADKSKTDKNKKADTPADSTKPQKIASFGDWAAYLAKGKAKTCYTLASPTERKPDLKRGAAYVFIADRPADKVHNEVSIIMGFPLKEEAAAQAKVGNGSFDLVAKGANAWIKDPTEEAKFVEALRHSAKLVVKAAAKKGPATTDVYALSGFGQALDRVSKECKAPARK